MEVGRRPDLDGDGDYSVAEAARLLGLSESAVRKRIDRGALTVVSQPGLPLRISASGVQSLRSRSFELLDVPSLSDLASDLEQRYAEAQARCEDLQARVDQLESEAERRQAAWESMLTAHAALQDALRHSTFDERIND